MNQDIRTIGKASAQGAVQRALTTAVAHIGAGRLDEAVAVLEANGGAALKNPVGRNILGDIRLKQGRPGDAERDFAAAIRMAPSFPEAHANRGVALQEMGRLNEALAAEDKAISYRADFATAHFNRGNILRALGRKEEAFAAYGRALKAQPLAEAHLNSGDLLLAKGEAMEALKHFRRAVELKPKLVAAHLGVAAAQRDLRQFDAALAAVDKALAVAPADDGAFEMRARILLAAEDYDEALAAADAIVSRGTDAAAGHRLRSEALVGLGRRDEALAAADKAIEIAPDDHNGHTTRAKVLYQLGRFEEQWEALETAVRLGGSGFALQHNRGLALAEAGRVGEAREAFDQAIAMEPANPLGYFGRSMVNLALGNFAEGWRDFDYRMALRKYVRPDALALAPLWKGEYLSGKKLLLHSEQGHGDTIQFARYVPLLRARGATLTLYVHDALQRLFAESFADCDVTSALGMRTSYDFQLPFMSLARVFETTEATIPREIPYLAVDPRRVAKWGERIGTGGFRVGVSWQGNPQYPGDRFRSIPLADFAPLAAVPGVRLISLQSFRGLEQLDALPDGMRVETLGEEVVNNPDGFREVAAVMANLDLMIMSDSAPGHLAGALGRPVWLALPHTPDWRWLRERTDSPWYPTMRLFRQKRRGDWPGVFAEIAGALAIEVAKTAGR